MNIGIIFGGVSPEHNVSINSAVSIINNLDKEKYNIKQIYIDEAGIWYENKKLIELDEIGVTKEKLIPNIKRIDNIIDFLKDIDLVFPVLHGRNGEDGAIQGLLEIVGKKYVGCGILSSSLGMDKIYAKIIFSKAGINQAKSLYLKKYNDKYIYVDNMFNETQYSLKKLIDKVQEVLKFPIFVKPSNSGSSIGINKAKNEDELVEYIDIASRYDNKIILEEEIKGRELECAVIGNEDVKASGVGEIVLDNEFYGFEEKYRLNTKTVSKANIPEEVAKEIKLLAKKAFKAIDGRGLARVDFFWDEVNNKIYINEINTIPGFTAISMYPKLWEESGISYKELLDKLIETSV